MSESLLQAGLEQALSKIGSDRQIAVAVSGGPDSSALAVCADAWARQHDRPLWLFHVNHGLQEQADQWVSKVQALGQLLHRPCVTRRVVVDLSSGHGVEGAARLARYRALVSMAAEHRVGVVLLAHHRQDQAETVLMRLLRGSGVTGLSAMEPVTKRGGLFWVRPWLDVSRETILDYLAVFSERTGWLAVQDPTNQAGDLARAVLRARVIPAIESRWPAWDQALARHAKQASEADRLLFRYGRQMLAQISLESPPGEPQTLSLARWRELNPDEQALAVRVWLRLAGMQMPTERRLRELLRQLRDVHALGHDRQLKWEQVDCEILCVRGQLHLRAKIPGFEESSRDGSESFQ